MIASHYYQLVLFFTLLLATLRASLAHERFNIHALEIDNPDQPVVDLSAFAHANGQLPGVYRVTVLVNGEPQGDAQDIAFVTGADHRLIAQLTPAMLKQWGVKIDAFPALARLPVDTPLGNIEHYIPMATAEFRFNKLQLSMTFPQAAINNVARGAVDPALWDEGVPAALLNYSFSGSNTRRDNESGAEENNYANLQSGLNFGAWRLRNYSTWNHDEVRGSQWDSINTYLQRDIHQLKGQLTLGDSYTPADIFDSVQFRGVQLVSDDNMLPDSLRGFAPTIRGIAQSNAQISIKQNGYVIYQSYVAPGAFTIDDLYPTSGSGDLEVTIKEADGSERTFIQPFSAVPVMQREGHLKYALNVGKYRSSNEESDEPSFGQIAMMYGLPHAVTLYGGTLYANDYHAGSLGLGMGLGTFGSLSADITAARTQVNGDEVQEGQSYRLQYAKDFLVTDTHFTLAAYRYSTAGFYTFQEANDLSHDTDDASQRGLNKHQRLQLELNQNFNDYGSFFISGYQQSYWYKSGYERTLSAGWSSNVKGISVSLTWSYSDYPESTEPADQQLAFAIQMPLNQFLSNAWTSFSINTSRHGDTRQQTGLSGTALADNNLSYSIQQSHTRHKGEDSGSLNVDYKGGQGEVTGGYNYDNHSQQVNYGLKGGIVAHPHGVTLAQPFGESLAVVKAPGAEHAKVQNATGVYTDSRGYAVVPYVNPYKKNRITLDTSTFDNDVDIDSAVQSVTPTQGAVVMVNFNTHIGRRVLVTLTYHGQPVPFGAQVSIPEGGSGIVGDSGQVYLTGVPEKGHIVASWNGGQQCKASYQLPANSDSSPVVEIKQECRG